MEGVQTTSVRQMVRTRTTCRMCGSRALAPIWSFGDTPLANAYVTPQEIGTPEVFAPLNVAFCEACALVQLLDVVDPTVLFSRYLYVSSTSPAFVAHFAAYAQHLRERFGLNEETLVIDVGSNDGILLQHLQKMSVPVLGIEPAGNIAAQANADGMETLPAFFTPDLARRLVEERETQAAVISANNVFAHMDDVDGFMEAVHTLLAPNGVFVFEVQYLGDLLEKNLFDIVYHEHLCYYHAHPLMRFFEKHDMNVFDIQRVPVHGGSLRVFVQNNGGPHAREERLAVLLAEEARRDLQQVGPYRAFQERMGKNRETLHTLLETLRAAGKRIVGYGAPAKATTLCYAFGLTKDTFEYIVDDDAKYKQGRVMPGTHIPIVTPEMLYTDKPDVCLLLAWNFAETIMNNHQRFHEAGGRFIIPVPEPQLV